MISLSKWANQDESHSSGRELLVMPALAIEMRHGADGHGPVLLGNLAQRTGRPIERDAEQRATNAMEVVALIWPLSPKLVVIRSGRLSSWYPGFIHRPRPSTGPVGRADSSHSEVVIRGRPRPLRGMSMSSDGT